MTWAKLDDSFPEHPKVASLSDKAFRLHVTAICYAARNLTDGFVPKAVLPMLGGSIKLAGELVTIGAWDKTPAGWDIHDFLDYNPSRASIEEERERKRIAGQAGGQASAKARAKAGRQARGQARATHSATGSSGTPDPIPSGSTEPDNAQTAETASAPPTGKARRIGPEDISRWESAHPDVDIPAMVGDYLNWKGSKAHTDQVRGFENQLRIPWKCEQFRKPESNPKRQIFKPEGIFSEPYEAMEEAR